MVNCGYQTRCGSQQVFLAAYKMIHISCSQRANNLWAKKLNYRISRVPEKLNSQLHYICYAKVMALIGGVWLEDAET